MNGGCGLHVIFPMRSSLSGIFENQGAVFVQLDFRCLPCWAYSFATFIAEATKAGTAS